ncbi:MAG: patatin-like phospholipase family protein [Acidimicrobiia bacterium]|nr:patatin-like phospholipase family protein [Acidimicrobiia bacterium]
MMDSQDRPELDVAELIGAAPLFAALSSAERDALAPHFDLITINGGGVLMAEGDPADSVFVVVHGRLRAAVRDSQQLDTVIGEIGRGEVVGDMALLSDGARTATVTAIRDTSLLRLARADFLDFIAEHPDALLQLTRLLTQRLQRTHRRRFGSGVHTVAVIPVGPGVNTFGFTGTLTVAADPIAQIQVIDRPRVVAQFGATAPDALPGSTEYAARAAWLDPFERDDALVIYVADWYPTEWTRHCIRQADRILLVADATTPPEPGEMEQAIHSHRSTNARVELILLHPPSTNRPTDTETWLRHRPGMRHHHIRIDRQRDFARLARLLTGRGVALVLSGGGARGFAHVGVIKALVEHGIPIDFVGGASFGSVVAAFHAMGDTPDEMIKHIKAVTVDRGSLIDFTFPAVSLSKGGKLSKGVRKSYGDAAIEDLWMGFFAVSSDLTDGKVRVHDAGPLWHAVRSSIAIPGTFPPVRDGDGHVLVDGGVMNNIPVDVMERFVEGGIIIAVDLRAGIDLPSADLSDDGIVSGWRVMRRRFNPFRRSLEVPRMIDTLLRATESASGRHEYHADLVLRPPVRDFGILSFRDHEQIIEAGYRYSLQQLEEWRDRPTWITSFSD